MKINKEVVTTEEVTVLAPYVVAPESGHCLLTEERRGCSTFNPRCSVCLFNIHNYEGVRKVFNE